MNESPLYRRRNAGLSDDIDRLPGTGIPQARACVVQTYTEMTYPTSAAAYYPCHPVRIGGAETEGGAGTVTLDTTTTLYVFNLGASVPASGTKLIAEEVGGRWVTRYG